MACLRETIICTNAGTVSIGPLRTNFSDILIGIQQNALETVVCEMVSISSGVLATV